MLHSIYIISLKKGCERNVAFNWICGVGTRNYLIFRSVRLPSCLFFVSQLTVLSDVYLHSQNKRLIWNKCKYIQDNSFKGKEVLLLFTADTVSTHLGLKPCRTQNSGVRSRSMFPSRNSEFSLVLPRRLPSYTSFCWMEEKYQVTKVYSWTKGIDVLCRTFKNWALFKNIYGKNKTVMFY